ncbi:hypothetical protein [Novosphingobium terrae]|uniref:hypothetical protein n=1 Tax=Novosphingobium terrae TaxID=2726189 RepID=UPI0019808E9E|nr:hypothetical protein [Novosphingobium terrae]
MADEDTPLPTGEHITRQYQQMRPLIGLLGLFNGDVRRQAKELEKQFADVERMKEDRQKFAARFGPRGWTIFDRLSVEAVRVAVTESDDDLADQGLVVHHLDADILSFLGYRFKTSRFAAWHDIYERAVERLLAQDYLSAVPLLLIIIDGICTTKTGKHPFSGGADAPVFDTETTGPGGLSDGLAILGATRRKLDTDAVDSPYRHGIVHGLNPNFGNALVAAKTVNLLQTIVDYFDRRADEEARIAKAAKDQRQPSWSELAATVSATQDTKRRIEAWKERQAISGQALAALGAPHNFNAESPEAAAVSYLDAIAARNFGTLAQMTIDYPLRSIGYRAGRHREGLGDLKLTSWTITGIRDEAPAISEVDVAMEGILNDSSWSGTQVMRLVYNDEKFEVRVRGAPDGRWTVMPNFLPTLWGTAVGSFGTATPSSDHDSSPPRPRGLGGAPK